MNLYKVTINDRIRNLTYYIVAEKEEEAYKRAIDYCNHCAKWSTIERVGKEEETGLFAEI